MADLPLGPRQISPDRRRETLIAALDEMSMSVSDLVSYMDDQAPLEDSGATIRSIKRMISGETRVSSEISSLAGSLLRRYRRLKMEHPSVEWREVETSPGNYIAKVGDWCAFLYPQSKGRYLLRVAAGFSSSDYSPPFGRWLSSIDEAKNKALLAIDEGKNQMAENIFYHPSNSK